MWEPDSEDRNKGQVPGDPTSRQQGSRGLDGHCGHVGPKGLIRPVVPVFMSLLVKFPIFLAKDDEDAKGDL